MPGMQRTRTVSGIAILVALGTLLIGPRVLRRRSIPDPPIIDHLEIKPQRVEEAFQQISASLGLRLRMSADFKEWPGNAMFYDPITLDHVSRSTVLRLARGVLMLGPRITVDHDVLSVSLERPSGVSRVYDVGPAFRGAREFSARARAVSMRLERQPPAEIATDDLHAQRLRLAAEFVFHSNGIATGNSVVSRGMLWSQSPDRFKFVGSRLVLVASEAEHRELELMLAAIPEPAASVRTSSRATEVDLDRHVQAMHLDGIPFQQAAHRLAKAAGCNLIICPATTQCGAPLTDKPVKLDIGPVSLRDALDALVVACKSPWNHVGWFTVDNVVVIAPTDGQNGFIHTRVYDVRDIVLKCIQTKREMQHVPGGVFSWPSMDGVQFRETLNEKDAADGLHWLMVFHNPYEGQFLKGGTARYFGGRFIVAATPAQHARIGRVLEELRREK